MDTLLRWSSDPLAEKLLMALIGAVIIVLIARFFRHSLGRYIQDNSARYQARKFVSFFSYIIIVAFIALVFSDRLGGLTIALGVAGAGVAFALQEAIASLAGWVAVSFGHFYKIGDRVQLGGIKGDVIDIGILRTTIMETGEWIKGDQYNGRVVRVTNSFVFKEPVYNYSGDFPFLWDEITLPVKYGSDYAAARRILHDAAQAVVGDYVTQAKQAWRTMTERYLIEHATVEPIVTLIANDNWAEFTLRYVTDYKLRRSTKDKLFTHILEAIDKSEGRVALASATFELVGLPPVRVRTDT